MNEVKCFTPREMEQIVKQFSLNPNQSRLAELWGVSRSTIHRVLENYEVEPRKLSNNDRQILKIIRVRELNRDSLLAALDKPALTVENIIKVLATAEDSQMLFILKQARELKDKLKQKAQGAVNAA